jgi:hypothetical protein
MWFPTVIDRRAAGERNQVAVIGSRNGTNMALSSLRRCLLQKAGPVSHCDCGDPVGLAFPLPPNYANDPAPHFL